MFRGIFAAAAVGGALLVAGAALAQPAAAPAPPPAAPAPPAEYPPNDYADQANWLCWPGRADACAGDLTATVVNADGSTEIQKFEADPNVADRLLLRLPHRLARSGRGLDDEGRAGRSERGDAPGRAASGQLPALRADVPSVHADRAGLRDGAPDSARPAAAARAGGLQRRPRRLELLPGAREPRPRRRAGRPLAGLRHADRAAGLGDRRQAGAGAAGLGDHHGRAAVRAGRQGHRRRHRVAQALHLVEPARLRDRLLVVPRDQPAAGQLAFRPRAKNDAPGMEAACVNPANLPGEWGEAKAYFGSKSIAPEPAGVPVAEGQDDRHALRHGPRPDHRRVRAQPASSTTSRSACTRRTAARAPTTSRATSCSAA